MIEVDKMGIMMLKKFVKYVSQNMLGMVGLYSGRYLLYFCCGGDGWYHRTQSGTAGLQHDLCHRGNDGCRFSDPSGDRAESGTSECRRILFPCTVMGIDCWPAFYACRNIFPG